MGRKLGLANQCVFVRVFGADEVPQLTSPTERNTFLTSASLSFSIPTKLVREGEGGKYDQRDAARWVASASTDSNGWQNAAEWSGGVMA